MPFAMPEIEVRAHVGAEGGVVKYQVLNGYHMYSTSPLMFLMLSSM